MYRIKQQKYIQNLEVGQSNGFQVSSKSQIKSKSYTLSFKLLTSH